MISHPGTNLLPHHGEILLFNNFFNRNDSDEFLSLLLNEVNWKHDHVKLFGRKILQPRLTASFADPGVEYGYSGIVLESYPWTQWLKQIKNKVEAESGIIFNTALLNLYRDGNDYMGWHRDDERNLGVNPPVASVSFGAERKFQLRTHATKSDLVSLRLGHGDLLLMLGEVQHYWEHRLPKDRRCQLPRVNITFRKVTGN